jgi:hypothetical protein
MNRAKSFCLVIRVNYARISSISYFFISMNRDQNRSLETCQWGHQTWPDFIGVGPIVELTEHFLNILL